MPVGILGWMKTKSILSGGSFGPLLPYINQYRTEIKEQEYAAGSICEQICVLKLFDRWLKRRGLEVRDLNEAVSHDFLGRLKRGYPKNAARSTLQRLLAMRRTGEGTFQTALHGTLWPHYGQLTGRSDRKLLSLPSGCRLACHSCPPLAPSCTPEQAKIGQSCD